MNNKKKILVFTATFNESENIEEYIRAIKRESLDYDLLIVDDNSPDKTADIIKNLQKEFQNINLVSRSGKLGLDSAHKIAYEYALEKNYDYLITMDADFSHDPKELKNFEKKLSTNPFVIGSRYVEGGKCLMKGKRLVMSRFGNLLIRYVSGIRCNEFTTSYRGFNLKLLGEFNLNLVTTKGYSFFMGTMFIIKKMRIPFIEIPIIFKDREKGDSKIPKIEILRTLKNLLILSLKK